MSSCTTGDVRLQDGPNVREGRVEICINNAWGTVCNNQFGVEDATVTCIQMNFSSEGKHLSCIEYSRLYIVLGTGARVVRTNSISLHGSPDTPIFLQGLGCQSLKHNNLLDCEATAIGITKCSHEQDAVVHCEGM